MYTKIQITNTKKIHTFVTKQYEVGTYVIIDNDPALQGGVTIKERDYHIKIRKETLKNKDSIIDGTILDYNGKFPINDFKKEIK